ncbi:MAG: hypothetical protein M3Q58_15070 [Bacteroidota bacterium]|nr:hypothetical protein [Bacteroidota bacterium]
MKRHLLILLVFFIAFIFNACHKGESTVNCDCAEIKGKTRVFYQSTNCDDPWGYAETSETTASIVKTYFRHLGMKLYNVGLDNNGTINNCYSCKCASGIRICAQIDEQDLLSMMENGFVPY